MSSILIALNRKYTFPHAPRSGEGIRTREGLREQVRHRSACNPARGPAFHYRPRPLCRRHRPAACNATASWSCRRTPMPASSASIPPRPRPRPACSPSSPGRMSRPTVSALFRRSCRRTWAARRATARCARSSPSAKCARWANASPLSSPKRCSRRRTPPSSSRSTTSHCLRWSMSKTRSSPARPRCGTRPPTMSRSG